MKFAVCVKQIPGADVPARLRPESWTLDRSGGSVLDEADTYSVEVALQLRDLAGGGEVVVISMAPDEMTEGLRTALAMGADRAVLVTDPALAGSDALSTAKVLAAAIRLDMPELVLCATESSDGYTGTVPVQIAELLGYPAVSFAKRIELSDGGLVAERQTESGIDEVRCPLPAVVTVTAGAVEPRYPTFKGIVGAKSKPVTVCSLDTLGLDAAHVGGHAARQRVLSVERAPTRSGGAVIRDEGAAEQVIVALLAQWGAV